MSLKHRLLLHYVVDALLDHLCHHGDEMNTMPHILLWLKLYCSLSQWMVFGDAADRCIVQLATSDLSWLKGKRSLELSPWPLQHAFLQASDFEALLSVQKSHVPCDDLRVDFVKTWLQRWYFPVQLLPINREFNSLVRTGTTFPKGLHDSENSKTYVNMRWYEAVIVDSQQARVWSMKKRDLI